MDPPQIISDILIENLFEESGLSARKKAAEQKTKGLSKEEFHRLRVRCKRDLFFLSYGILRYKRLSINLHGNLCQHIKETGHERFHEYLMPRGHFKSTIITIGHSIQTILPYTEEDALYDDDPMELPWPMSLGTDARLLIAHETHEGAARFLFSITRHFTTNISLMALFPEAVPSIRKHRVNKWELELPRSEDASHNPEPTIDTIGVGGKSQGRHYNHIKLDDIYGDKARDSKAESDTCKEWFDNIQSFFSVFSQDHLDLIGTRYSHDDVYAHAHERYGPKLKKYIRKIEEKNAAGEMEIVFKEEFDDDSLAILKKNRKVYSAQYENDPDEGETTFDAEWKRYFYWRSLTTIATFSGNSSTLINIRDLYIAFLIDPGASKSGGFVVTGTDHTYRNFVLLAQRLEMSHPAFVEFLFKQVARWQPQIVAIESDLFAAVYEHWINAEMRRRNVRFMIKQVYTKKKSKPFRINGLSTYWSAGQIIHNEAQTELDREFDQWGKTMDIHILDALAYGPEVWQRGYVPGTRAVEPSFSEEQDDNRDIQTGYSAID